MPFESIRIDISEMILVKSKFFGGEELPKNQILKGSK